MDLYIVRHAVAHMRDAELWPDDSKRPLTPRGEERFRCAAGGILRLVPEVGVVLSNPFVRAWRTAELLEQAGWPAPVSCEELEADYPPHKVVGALAPYVGMESVALVGHRPQLHELASYLLTGDAGGAYPDQKRRCTASLLRRPARTGRGLPPMAAHAKGAESRRLTASSQRGVQPRASA